MVAMYKVVTRKGHWLVEISTKLKVEFKCQTTAEACAAALNKGAGFRGPMPAFMAIPIPKFTGKTV